MTLEEMLDKQFETLKKKHMVVASRVDRREFDYGMHPARAVSGLSYVWGVGPSSSFKLIMDVQSSPFGLPELSSETHPFRTIFPMQNRFVSDAMEMFFTEKQLDKMFVSAVQRGGKSFVLHLIMGTEVLEAKVRWIQTIHLC